MDNTKYWRQNMPFQGLPQLCQVLKFPAPPCSPKASRPSRFPKALPVSTEDQANSGTLGGTSPNQPIAEVRLVFLKDDTGDFFFWSRSFEPTLEAGFLTSQGRSYNLPHTSF